MKGCFKDEAKRFKDGWLVLRRFKDELTLYTLVIFMYQSQSRVVR